MSHIFQPITASFIVLTAIYWSLFLWISHIQSHPTHSMKDDITRIGHIGTKELQDKWTILRKRLTWVEGDIECYELLGTHMAVVDTQDKAKELAKAIYEISVWNGTHPDYHLVTNKYEWGMERRYWVGLTDEWGNHSEYNWKVPDVSSVQQALPYVAPPPPPERSWTSKQPDHMNISQMKKAKAKHRWEHCVGYWNPNYFRGDMHTLNDLPCHHRYYAICDNSPFQK